jgi:Txe/YoeB family toxin of Txe-Axe toxin-antitoxin module
VGTGIAQFLSGVDDTHIANRHWQGERLKHRGGEVWSRRITEKDRLVYDIQSDVIAIIACRFRYDDH